MLLDLFFKDLWLPFYTAADLKANIMNEMHFKNPMNDQFAG